MLDDIGPLAIGAVQHLHNHRCSLSHGWFCSAQTLIQDSRSTALKHLPGALCPYVGASVISTPCQRITTPVPREIRSENGGIIGMGSEQSRWMTNYKHVSAV